MTNHQALTPDTLAARLGALSPLRDAAGGDPAAWRIDEIGDGNLNLVFLVEGPDGSAIVKQALPYVRLVGDSWPLPLTRAHFEHEALKRQAARDPGRVPRVLHFDPAQALIVMERLTPHVILRRRMMAGERVEGLAAALGRFCARTAFLGSDLAMDPAAKKADAAEFAGNHALCRITEDLVFTDPYFAAPMNRHTTPQLDALVARLRGDARLKAEAQHLKRAFMGRAETLCHGDLHTGSVMVTGTDTRVIDPEFAFYGPLGFDLGMLIGNFLMAFHATRAHLPGDRAEAYRAWLLTVVAGIWDSFRDTFASLWEAGRHGTLYPATVCPAGSPASDMARDAVLAEVFAEAAGFAGVEMHRRILGLAHIAELDEIADADLRAACEARCLALGRRLVLDRATLTLGTVLDLARGFEADPAPSG